MHGYRDTDLDTDFARRIWPVIDVYARIERAEARRRARQLVEERASRAVPA